MVESRAAQTSAKGSGFSISVMQPGVSSIERVKGIEPSSVAWEATALPLSYTRVGRTGLMYGFGAAGATWTRAAPR